MSKIKAKIIMEVLGKPKKHVEETIKQYVEDIKKKENYKVISEEFADVQEQDDDFFSTFVEIELETEKLEYLTGFCFDYMPASIDIVEPSELKLTAAQLNNIMNDLQGKLHSIDMVTKQFNSENNFLKNNIKILIKNLILVILIGKKLSKEQLAKGTGTKVEEIDTFIDELINENRIKEEDDKYVLVTKSG